MIETKRLIFTRNKNKRIQSIAIPLTTLVESPQKHTRDAYNSYTTPIVEK